jgi:hypothetical protein
MPESDPLLDVAELAVQEMGRRLREDPSKIPDGALSKVIADTLRIAEKRERQEDEGESKPFNLLDELPTMPKDRAVELVSEELVRLGEEIVQYHKVLEELEPTEEGAGQDG